MFSGYDNNVKKWVIGPDTPLVEEVEEEECSSTARAYKFFDWFSKEAYAKSKGYRMIGEGDIDDFIVREDGAGFLLYIH